MADISYPQLVHNIKEKYIEATGEPDNIKFGEIAQDIYDAITSGGGKADGSPAHPFNINYEMPITATAEAHIGEPKELNYIQSSGTQYIDTGIAPTNHRIVAKFQYLTLPSDACIFGGKRTNGQLCMDLAWYQNKWYYVDSSTQGYFSLSTIATDEVTVDFNNYDNQIIINEVVGATINGTNNNNYPLYIFRRNASPYAYSTMKLFYFQMYDRSTEELVLDLIPTERPDGVICMFDNVSQTYFTNAGTGDFISGGYKQ